MTFAPDREAQILLLADNYRNAMEAFESAKAAFETAKKPIENAKAEAKVRENAINAASKELDLEKQRISKEVRSAVLAGDQALILSSAAELHALTTRIREMNNWTEERLAIRERVMTLTEEYLKLCDDWASTQQRLASASCYAERAFEAAVKSA